VSSGSDCAWIDFIIMPPPPVTTAYAGPDAVSCGTAPYTTQGGATLYNIVNWMSSGSGYFDNQQSLDAVYHPSDADVNSGSVILGLTAYYSGGTQVTDEMELALTAEPVAFAGNDNAVATGSSYTLSDAVAENYTDILWTSNGDGAFDDATIMNPTYTPGSDDIINGEVTLSMMVIGEAPCGNMTDDMLLTVGINTGVIEQDGYNLALYPNPNNGTFNIELKGQNIQNVSITIYNILGDVIYWEDQITLEGAYSSQLSIEADPGLYFIRVEGENLLINQKITIRK
ncbi:MAG TPA: T9SS type A sorting domain-containing protein, partial [Bacteroidales bacterium]|nr:T9SS type A sorting domain-containing protein [Bacteroidales bacterium]